MSRPVLRAAHGGLALLLAAMTVLVSVLPGTARPAWAAAPATATQPAPTAPQHSGSGKRIVYAITTQRVWLVDSHEKVLHTYLVSGRPDRPKPRSYRVYSKSMHTRSSVSAATMRYMVRFTHGPRTGSAIGFHDIPRRLDGTPERTTAQLGKPLSAGCIRQATPDAAYLWRFAPVGTRVVVVA